MWDWLADRCPRAKKDYLCSLCDEYILKGKQHIARVVVDPHNTARTFRLHFECEELTKKLEWGNEDWEYNSPWEFRQLLVEDGYHV